MTRRTLVVVIALAAVAVVVGDVLREAKVAFPGYYAAFGFGGAIAVIAVSRWVVAPLLRRPDDSEARSPESETSPPESDASASESDASAPESEASAPESEASLPEGRDG